MSLGYSAHGGQLHQICVASFLGISSRRGKGGRRDCRREKGGRERSERDVPQRLLCSDPRCLPVCLPDGCYRENSMESLKLNRYGCEIYIKKEARMEGASEAGGAKVHLAATITFFFISFPPERRTDRQVNQKHIEQWIALSCATALLVGSVFFVLDLIFFFFRYLNVYRSS